jgi:Methyltransferase domain
MTAWLHVSNESSAMTPPCEDEALLPLTRASYGRAFEPLCSMGRITRQLARRCVEVVATDPRAEAVEATRVHCSPYENVDIRQAPLLSAPPSGCFDLILLHELTHYGASDEVLTWLGLLAARLQFGGEMVLIERLHPHPGDYFTPGRLRRVLAFNGTMAWIGAEAWESSRVDTWRRL